MEPTFKPYVHLAINAVDTVAFDPEGRYDVEQYDHYATFEQARDAALSSIELMLDEGDYDGDDHREELEQMLGLLETAASFSDLAGQGEYQKFAGQLAMMVPAAA